MVQSSSGLNGDSDPRGRGESAANLNMVTLEPEQVQRDSSRRLATAGRVKRIEVRQRELKLGIPN